LEIWHNIENHYWNKLLLSQNQSFHEDWVGILLEKKTFCTIKLFYQIPILRRLKFFTSKDKIKELM
jgi:hypothetical protein